MADPSIEDIFPPNISIIRVFKNLVDANSENGLLELDMFLKNIERVLLSNKKIFPGEIDALEYAIRRDKFKSAEVLINGKKVDINSQNVQGNTPLMLCILSKSKDAYNLALKLLKQRCRVEIRNNFGENALIMACSRMNDNYLKIANILLDKNVDEQQFALDDSGNGGLDYLVVNAYDYLYGEDGVKTDIELTQSQSRELKRFFEDLVVKYIKLYKDRRSDADEVLIRNLVKICKDENLKRAFSTKLLEIGISLDIFCGQTSPAITLVEPGVQLGKFLEGDFPLARRSHKPVKIARASLMNPVIAERIISGDGEVSPSARAMGSSDEYEYLPYIPPEGGNRKKSQKKKKRIKNTRKCR